MSVHAKFQLPRGGWSLCVGWVVVVVEHVATVSNLNPSYIELLWAELSYVELGLGFDKSLFLHKVL